MKPNRQKEPSDFQPDALGELPMTIATYAFWGGLISLVASLAVVFFCMMTAAGDQTKAATLANTIKVFDKGLILGAIAMVIGSAWLFWEEEVMVAMHLFGASVLFFAPTLVPLVMTESQNAAYVGGIEAISGAGKIYLGFALTILIADLALRVKKRVTQGTKADLLKYGKGIKEEVEKQNVFLGKCWQLPFCRKYVREKCPIYHAKRTCWRELVGCMCEESVIRMAMESKPISKDALLSGSAIPRNNKLTVNQKRERCKNCVIYNEHQKHKYKLAMPVVLVGYGLFYALFREPLANAVDGFLGTAGKTVKDLSAGAVSGLNTGSMFTQFLVGAIILVLMSYTIKMVEYALFKLKI
jgi:hypothetical protein